tara:strand:+ start:345 stop:470 length:126 start_codon:yes stop_codon:yes gene_type:complete
MGQIDFILETFFPTREGKHKHPSTAGCRRFDAAKTISEVIN